MGLILIFSISLTPRVDVLSKDGLTAAIINVDVPHHLFPATTHPGERFHLPLRDSEQLCR
jgi:hypothetical protein